MPWCARHVACADNCLVDQPWPSPAGSAFSSVEAKKRRRHKGKRTCRAHHTGTCDQSLDGVCTIPEPAAISYNTTERGCGRSTAGTNVCFAYAGTADYIAGCRTDADCEAPGYLPGAACVPYNTGQRAGHCPGGTICLIPCDVDLPVPDPELSEPRPQRPHSGRAAGRSRFMWGKYIPHLHHSEDARYRAQWNDGPRVRPHGSNDHARLMGSPRGDQQTMREMRKD